jgi:aminoglycoside phosphotransferase (APT) family kinase protein
MQTRSRLREACALAPTMLADETDLVVSNAQATSTGMAIVAMGETGGPPRFVIKMPMTHQAEEGLGRETRVLANLHADERLGDWRQLIPRPITEGTAGRWVYRVDAALAGVPAADGVAREGGRGRLQEAAAETIHFLHRATTRTVHGDRALAERWVDARLHDLWPRSVRRGSLGSRCTRLREELHGAVLGRALRTSWVHGDFWLGNLLLSQQDGSIRGIVDWDAASPDELALHDVMHLLLYTRRMATGQELGLIVRNQLRDGAWPDHERALLERYGAQCHQGALSDRHALLLYWLRQVAAHARQQPRRGGARYRLWERRNVHRVLAEL